MTRARRSCGGIFDFDAKQARLAEVSRELEKPDVLSDSKRAQDLGREKKQLDNLVGVLTDLGVVVDHPAPGVYEVAAGDVDWLFVPLEAAAKMRASFILLGPLLTRFGRVIISNPGGDRIGRRPVNLHVDAMRALGAEVTYRNGYYFAQAPGRLPGREVVFPFDAALRAGVDMGRVPVARTGHGPLVRERYRVDENGIIQVTITDLDSGYSREYRLGA